MNTYEFIDQGDSLRIKGDNLDKVFPKNSLSVETSLLNNTVIIKSLKHLEVLRINYGTDTLIPAQASKEDFIQFLSFFFRSN